LFCYEFFSLVFVSISQILIVLLLGNNLNIGIIEFRHDESWNMQTINGLAQNKPTNRFNLGFYFDFLIVLGLIPRCSASKYLPVGWLIRYPAALRRGASLMNPKLLIHKGFMIKSSMGVRKIPVYSFNNPEFYSAFDNGSIEWKIKYFHLPKMIEFRFVDQFFIEDFLMTGLRYMPYDEFTDKVVDKKNLYPT
jgi:hypothetical protein